MIEIVSCDETDGPKILVLGIGGGGNNAVERMIEAKLKGVTFAAVNTDIAVLRKNSADLKMQIGEKLLKGYGAGADPTLGEAAAMENEEDIRAMVAEYNMIIITCGMGGGTGTGAAPFIAKCCQDAGILTMGVVTTPFSFENRPRRIVAEGGISKLKENVDTLLVIPNDKLLEMADRQLKLKDAFILADSVLRYTIEGITNIVYNLGTINIDFNDLKTALTKKGIGHLGIGKADSESSILEAVKQAIKSPLLETSIEGAEMILLNTSGDVTLAALNEAASYVREIAGENVNVIWGTVDDVENPEDTITVTLIATGMPEEQKSTNMHNERKVEFNLKKDNKYGAISNTEKSSFDKCEEPKVKYEKQVEIPVFLRDYSIKHKG